MSVLILSPLPPSLPLLLLPPRPLIGNVDLFIKKDQLNEN